jgi:hypothetical protein
MMYDPSTSDTTARPPATAREALCGDAREAGLRLMATCDLALYFDARRVIQALDAAMTHLYTAWNHTKRTMPLFMANLEVPFFWFFRFFVFSFFPFLVSVSFFVFLLC